MTTEHSGKTWIIVSGRSLPCFFTASTTRRGAWSKVEELYRERPDDLARVRRERVDRHAGCRGGLSRDRILYRSDTDQRYPEDAIDRAFCRAMEAAEDAAREVLEAIPLTPVVKMHSAFWEYARQILGGYDSTMPTGTRLGKRWCRHDRDGRWIGEYSANNVVTWRKVVLE